MNWTSICLSVLLAGLLRVELTAVAFNGISFVGYSSKAQIANGNQYFYRWEQPRQLFLSGTNNNGSDDCIIISGGGSEDETANKVDSSSEASYSKEITNKSLEETNNIKPDRTTTTESPRKVIVNAIFNVWSVFIIFLGASATCGILLNLLGYGYQFSMADGLRIDTIEQMRIERQFDAATRTPRAKSTTPQEQQQEQKSKFQPLEFVQKSPFLTATIITAGVVVYEELNSGNKKKK